MEGNGGLRCKSQPGRGGGDLFQFCVAERDRKFPAPDDNRIKVAVLKVCGNRIGLLTGIVLQNGEICSGRKFAALSKPNAWVRGAVKPKTVFQNDVAVLYGHSSLCDVIAVALERAGFFAGKCWKAEGSAGGKCCCGDDEFTTFHFYNPLE